MTIELILRAVTKSDLSPYARLAALVLAQRGEVTHWRQRDVASGIGCGLTAAGAALDELAVKGWVTTTPCFDEEGDGRQKPNRYRLHIPTPIATRQGGVSPSDESPYRETTSKTQSLKKFSDSDTEEKNGAPGAGAPHPFQPPQTGRDGGASEPDAATRLIEQWEQACLKKLKRVPPSVPGRDRKIISDLLRRYGEADAGRIVIEFVRYRAHERRIVTIPALLGAAEAVFQHLPKPRIGPGNDLGLRKWNEHVQRERERLGRASPSAEAGGTPP